jgi:HEPN domain-containing protein
MKKATEEWLQFARRDILSARNLLKDPETVVVAAYHCQQAVEKYLKAMQAELEIEIKHIHNLVTIYGTIKPKLDMNIDPAMLTSLNEVYFDTRYPGTTGILPDGTLPSEEKVQEYLKFAESVKTTTTNLLEKGKNDSQPTLFETEEKESNEGKDEEKDQ